MDFIWLLLDRDYNECKELADAVVQALLGDDHEDMTLVVGETEKYAHYNGWARYGGKIRGIPTDTYYNVTCDFAPGDDRFPYQFPRNHYTPLRGKWIRCWKEEYVFLVAHEVAHVLFHKRGWNTSSEVQINRVALEILERYRKEVKKNGGI